MSKASETQIGGTHYKDMGEHQPWDVLDWAIPPAEIHGRITAYCIAENQQDGNTV